MAKVNFQMYLTVFERKRTKYWAARNGGLILIEKKLRFPWNERPHSFVSTRVVSSYQFVMIGYGFATFVMHDVISNKTCNTVQVTQKP